jgi:glycerol-3-phosphate dehydrogenase subunit C
VDYCSGCGICTQVCPQDVKIAEINSQARAQLWEERGIPLRNQLIARPSVLGRLGTPVAPFANWAIRSAPLRRLAHRLLGIHRDAPLPPFAGRTFQSWARSHDGLAGERGVVYFHGCGTNYYEPGLGEMVVGVLEHNGFHVVVPPQDCCGLPLQSNGNFKAARAYLQRLVANLAPYARDGLPIVANSTSCALMLKREAREILGLVDEDLEAVSEATYDICEFLLLLHDRGELRTDLQPLPLTIPYHAPCQLRGHGIGKPALDLLALIEDLRVIELDADCCGIAGTYGLKREKYEISMAVGKPLFTTLREIGGDLAACDSETCRWQIEHGAGVQAVHPVELLHRAYGLGAAGAVG